MPSATKVAVLACSFLSFVLAARCTGLPAATHPAAPSSPSSISTSSGATSSSAPVYVAKGTTFPAGTLRVLDSQVDGRRYRVQAQLFMSGHKGFCWNALGRDRKGHIFLGVSSDKTNSYIYRLNPRTREIRYLGDLQSNLRYEESDGTDNGKVHTSFYEWQDGCVYFLSHAGDQQDVHHGGHLWKYDPVADAIVDLSIPVPRNTSMCLTEPDASMRFCYAMSTLDGVFMRIDCRTAAIQRLETTRMPFVRNMPMDAQSNLYILWEGVVHEFSPALGYWRTIAFEDHSGKSFGNLSAFTWSKDRTTLYFVNYDKGELFQFSPRSSKVDALGKMDPAGADLYMTNLHISQDQSQLYSIAASGLWAYDLASSKHFKLVDVNTILSDEGLPSISIAGAAEYGGVTGDDGTFYTGITAGDKVGILAFKVSQDRMEHQPASAP